MDNSDTLNNLIIRGNKLNVSTSCIKDLTRKFGAEKVAIELANLQYNTKTIYHPIRRPASWLVAAVKEEYKLEDEIIVRYEKKIREEQERVARAKALKEAEATEKARQAREAEEARQLNEQNAKLTDDDIANMTAMEIRTRLFDERNHGYDNFKNRLFRFLKETRGMTDQEASDKVEQHSQVQYVLKVGTDFCEYKKAANEKTTHADN